MSQDKHRNMNKLFEVSEVRISLYGKDGVLAFCEVVLGNYLRLNDIAVKRTNEGKILLSYPLKKTQSGAEYFYYNPISKELGDKIREAVLSKLNEIISELGVINEQFR